jgi:phosphatidylglycerophosphatase C
MDRTAAVVVAAFDLDGTITRRDTLLPWLVELVGRRRLAAASARLLPRFVAAAVGRGDRNAAKAALFGKLLRGVPMPDAASAAERVANRLRSRPRALRAPVLARLRQHQADGHMVIVVSASPEIVVAAVVEHLEIPAANVIGTRLVVDGENRLTGELLGLNNRDAEKVVRLQAWEAGIGAAAGGVERWAYGDSSGDDALLAHADHAFRVDRGGLEQVK